MKRISQNRELFEASAGETITVTVTASDTPYQATFSDLESDGKWAPVQNPTPPLPTEIRRFTMPAGKREFFNIVFAFPPSGQTSDDARYTIAFSGKDGSSDGPTAVLPPFSGDIDNLSYEFRLA